jgi:23S rRNA-/tRNA-specific pseudouridylate synthase
MGTGLSLNQTSEIALDKLFEAYLMKQGSTLTGHLAHRLDRKTSGLIALAKTKEMAHWLGMMFKERDAGVYKAYYALLCGIPPFQQGLIR